jgi:hypothetical protein
MIERLIGQVFGDADDDHKEHLLTRSYAQHMALGDFYDGVRDALDAVVEAHIALVGPDDIADPTGTPLEQLEDGYVALMGMREKVCDGCPTIENLYDTLTGEYLTAIYKLKRLK